MFDHDPEAEARADVILAGLDLDAPEDLETARLRTCAFGERLQAIGEECRAYLALEGPKDDRVTNAMNARLIAATGVMAELQRRFYHAIGELYPLDDPNHPDYRPGV